MTHLDKPTIIIDTREPLRTAWAWPGWPSVRRALSWGDYALAGSENREAVERKTLSDLAASIQRGRFWREVERAEGDGGRLALVVEGTQQDAERGRWRSLVLPAAVLGACRALEERGHSVIWGGDRAGAAAAALAWLLAQQERGEER